MFRLLVSILFATLFFLECHSQNLDSLHAIITTEKRDSAYVVTLARIAQAYRGKDNEKASYYAKQILKYPDVHPTQTGRSTIMLALLYADRNMNDSARIFFKQAELISNKYPEEKTLMSGLYNGLGIFYKKQGDNERSLHYFVRVDSLGEAGMGLENLAGNQLNIANTYNRMGNRREAIKYLYKALATFESINSTKGLSYCYNSLGVLLKQQGNLERAGYYLRKSLELKEKEGDVKGIANSNNELALLYVESSELEKALAHADVTISLSKKLKAQELLATALTNKGKIFRIQGKWDSAFAALQKARPLAEQLPNHFVLSQLQSESGKLLTETKQNEKAIKVLLSSISEAEKSSNVEAMLNAYRFLSQAYSRNGQHKEALDLFQKYHQLEDSIRGRKLQVDYKTLETQYEVEKKNAEIALLKKDQELQARTAQRQRAIQTGIAIALFSVIIISLLLINRYRIINKTKRLLEIERVRNTIARDLHDDIGSTMSSINIVSQMALQQNRNAGMSQDYFKKIAEQSSDLMERMSDIVWSINPVNDSMQMMVAKMKEFTAEILEPKNIQYRFNGIETLNGEILEVEKRRNIFLIFKEAVNNAAKYSEATEVNIKVEQKEKTLQLVIADNGKGFDLEAEKTGNGLRNMAQRAKAIDGSMTVNTKMKKGTSLTFVIPLT